MNTSGETAFPVPEINDVNRPYWDGLKNGNLLYQACGDCGHTWLPARTECPVCLSANTSWKPASGKAKLVSWVTYHKAFNPAFQDRIPYNVSVVELVEGPRMISNVIDLDDPEDLRIEQELELHFREEHSFQIPVFRKAK